MLRAGIKCSDGFSGVESWEMTMQDDLVDVYEAATLMEAQLLSDRLDSYEVRSFIDNTDSPFDGLTAAEQVKIVRVLPDDVDKARRIIAEFEAEKSTD